MVIKDYMPSLKTVGAFVAGAVIAGGVVFALNPSGMIEVEKEFVPSKETCDKYVETRNGRFICFISGTKPAGGGE